MNSFDSAYRWLHSAFERSVPSIVRTETSIPGEKLAKTLLHSEDDVAAQNMRRMGVLALGLSKTTYANAEILQIDVAKLRSSIENDANIRETTSMYDFLFHPDPEIDDLLAPEDETSFAQKLVNSSNYLTPPRARWTGPLLPVLYRPVDAHSISLREYMDNLLSRFELQGDVTRIRNQLRAQIFTILRSASTRTPYEVTEPDTDTELSNIDIMRLDSMLDRFVPRAGPTDVGRYLTSLISPNVRADADSISDGAHGATAEIHQSPEGDAYQGLEGYTDESDGYPDSASENGNSDLRVGSHHIEEYSADLYPHKEHNAFDDTSNMENYPLDLLRSEGGRVDHNGEYGWSTPNWTPSETYDVTIENHELSLLAESELCTGFSEWQQSPKKFKRRNEFKTENSADAEPSTELVIASRKLNVRNLRGYLNCEITLTRCDNSGIVHADLDYALSDTISHGIDFDVSFYALDNQVREYLWRCREHQIQAQNRQVQDSETRKDISSVLQQAREAFNEQFGSGTDKHDKNNRAKGGQAKDQAHKKDHSMDYQQCRDAEKEHESELETHSDVAQSIQLIEPVIREVAHDNQVGKSSEMIQRELHDSASSSCLSVTGVSVQAAYSPPGDRTPTDTHTRADATIGVEVLTQLDVNPGSGPTSRTPFSDDEDASSTSSAQAHDSAKRGDDKSLSKSTKEYGFQSGAAIYSTDTYNTPDASARFPVAVRPMDFVGDANAPIDEDNDVETDTADAAGQLVSATAAIEGCLDEMELHPTDGPSLKIEASNPVTSPVSSGSELNNWEAAFDAICNRPTRKNGDVPTDSAVKREPWSAELHKTGNKMADRGFGRMSDRSKDLDSSAKEIGRDSRSLAMSVKSELEGVAGFDYSNQTANFNTQKRGYTASAEDSVMLEDSSGSDADYEDELSGGSYSDSYEALVLPGGSSEAAPPSSVFDLPSSLTAALSMHSSIVDDSSNSYAGSSVHVDEYSEDRTSSKQNQPYARLHKSRQPEEDGDVIEWPSLKQVLDERQKSAVQLHTDGTKRLWRAAIDLLDSNGATPMTIVYEALCDERGRTINFGEFFYSMLMMASEGFVFLHQRPNTEIPNPTIYIQQAVTGHVFRQCLGY